MTHSEEAATVITAAEIPPISRDEGLDLNAVAYDRMLEVLRGLPAEDWAAPTECDGWTVADIVAHVIGAAESHASLRELIHQARLGRPIAKRTGRDLVDGINEVQVRERAHLSPAEMIERLAAAAPASVRGRRKTPGLMRRFSVAMPAPIGRETVGYLHDCIYLRDTWLHRVDISRATGAELLLTPEHDGRIIADVIGDWARRHGRPFTLRLSGPAGGTYVQGDGGEEHELDAVELARILSGRAPGTGVLAIPHVF